jgi:2,3-bisphosphoglycerate-independent phosphoglycerate mutase
MKCVVVLACGLAEDPREQLNGKTPLDAARTPVLDQMASRGILGLTRTIPRGARLACETGGASLLGYDPALHPVRAAGLAVEDSGHDHHATLERSHVPGAYPGAARRPGWFRDVSSAIEDRRS